MKFIFLLDHHILHYRYPFIYNDDQTLTLLRRFICSTNTQRIALFDQYCSNQRELQILTNEYRLENPIASYPCKFGLYLTVKIKIYFYFFIYF